MVKHRDKISKGVAFSYLLLVFAFMYIPILCIVALSFCKNGKIFSISGGFSVESYRALFDAAKASKLSSAIANTLIIALASSFAATLIGVFASIGIFSLGRRSKRLASNLNQLPLINSEMVMAVSFMVFFTALKIPEGFLQLIIAHVCFCTPYVVLSITPRLYQIDPNIYEAALDLGATPTKALFKVQIPMLIPNIISGFAMAFTISLDDFIVTQMNKGTSTGIETLSTYLYEDAKKKGLEPFWVSLFSIIFGLVLVVLVILNIKHYVGANKKSVHKGDM